MRIFTLLLLALIAFAGNSLLNRAALADGAIGWADFTIIRLFSGALFLVVLVAIRNGAIAFPKQFSLAAWMMPAMLFAYAALFSWAYLGLTAATGALILFGCVQMTMQGIGLARGSYPSALQLMGTALAFAGLVWLLLPGVAAPPLLPGLAMAGAGIAWGIYSWLGRGVADPVQTTAANFSGSLVFCLLLVALAGLSGPVTLPGIMLAVASGAITSGLGYVLWYAVLPRLSVTNAAVAQLSVPAIAAMGGIVLLGEALTARVAIGGAIILAGIGLTIMRRP
ncbi:MAG: DMT family transporter [Pseudomonadota bacterium]